MPCPQIQECKKVIDPTFPVTVNDNGQQEYFLEISAQ